MLKGCISVHLFFYEKNFHSKTLDFTSFLKIIEKKLNASYSHLKKLCTFVRSIRHKT